MINEYIILIVAIIIHELGHLIGYWLYGFRPDIRFKWYGVLIGQNIYFLLKPLQAYFVNMFGVIFGLIPLYIFHVDKFIFVVYVIMSMIDIVNVLGLLSIEKRYMRYNLLKINEMQLKELKKSVVGKTKSL